MSAVSGESTANDREACFYCSGDAKIRFCCPDCEGPGKILGQAPYLLCESCLAERACRYCLRRPQPADAFTDPDLRSLQPVDPSWADSSSLAQGADPTLVGDLLPGESGCCQEDVPHVFDRAGEAWILVEMSCVLLHRSPARLRGIQEDGFDGRREPFYLRPGTPQFLEGISRMPQARLALTTTMRPATYQPLLDHLAQVTFGASEWDEARYPVFDKRDTKSERHFPDGREAPALDVTGLRRYASDVLGHHMKEGCIVLIQSLKQVVSEAWRPNVLLIPAMQPSDLLTAPDMLREELLQVLHCLQQMVITDDFRHHLQHAPCVFERPCKDLAVDMDERPPWASEADFVDKPVKKCQYGLERDSGVVAEKLHGLGESHWHLFGPAQANKYEWNGVRFHQFPATCSLGSHFEVTVGKGLVRLGWSTAHALLDLGKDRGEGFPHVGYGGSGKLCVCGSFENFGEPFGRGDVISCQLCVRHGRWLAVFIKNSALMGEVHPFDALDGSSELYPHISGKLDFEVTVRLALPI